MFDLSVKPFDLHRITNMIDGCLGWFFLGFLGLFSSKFLKTTISWRWFLTFPSVLSMVFDPPLESKSCEIGEIRCARPGKSQSSSPGTGRERGSSFRQLGFALWFGLQVSHIPPGGEPSWKYLFSIFVRYSSNISAGDLISRRFPKKYGYPKSPQMFPI